MKIIAFAASSSRNSINKQLVTYAASLYAGAEVEVLDLNQYELPLFSVDKEQELGKPQLAQDFLLKLEPVMQLLFHTQSIMGLILPPTKTCLTGVRGLISSCFRISRWYCSLRRLEQAVLPVFWQLPLIPRRILTVS